MAQQIVKPAFTLSKELYLAQQESKIAANLASLDSMKGQFHRESERGQLQINVTEGEVDGEKMVFLSLPNYEEGICVSAADIDSGAVDFQQACLDLYNMFHGRESFPLNKIGDEVTDPEAEQRLREKYGDDCVPAKEIEA